MQVGCLGKPTAKPPGDGNNLMQCMDISGFTRSRLNQIFSLLVRVLPDKIDISGETCGNYYLEKA